MVSFLFWLRILMGMHPPIICTHLAETSHALMFLGFAYYSISCLCICLRTPMNSYLKGAPCLVKGLIILLLNYCVSTIKFLWALLPRSELTLPYLACKWRHHHSSLGLGWLRSPLWVACFFHASSSMLSIFYVSSFICSFKCCWIRVCVLLETNSLLPFMGLRNEPSHLDSMLF